MVGFVLFLVAERLWASSWAGIADYTEVFRFYTIAFAAAVALLGLPAFFVLRRVVPLAAWRIAAPLLGWLVGLTSLLGASLLTGGDINWTVIVRPAPEALRIEVLFFGAGLALGALVVGLHAFEPPRDP